MDAKSRKRVKFRKYIVFLVINPLFDFELQGFVLSIYASRGIVPSLHDTSLTVTYIHKYIIYYLYIGENAYMNKYLTFIRLIIFFRLFIYDIKTYFFMISTVKREKKGFNL